MSAICLVAGLLMVPLGETITLRWTHSIQKTLWEEDYRRQGNMLLLEAARIQGTGAGMEPPPDAILRDGAWHYKPAIGALPNLRLRHSPHVPPYIICVATDCRPLPAWLPGIESDTVVELQPCPPAAS